MARISQLLSSTQPSVLLKPDQIKTIPDTESDQKSVYTDGVGLISPALADEVEKALTKDLHPAAAQRRVTSTCFQVRSIFFRSHFELCSQMFTPVLLLVQIRLGGAKGM